MATPLAASESVTAASVASPSVTGSSIAEIRSGSFSGMPSATLPFNRQPVVLVLHAEVDELGVVDPEHALVQLARVEAVAGAQGQLVGQ